MGISKGTSASPPHPGSFSKSVKTQDLEHTELGRIYGKLEIERGLLPSPAIRIVIKTKGLLDLIVGSD
jgi:hypothetical protein